ncbi:uncharacterized protein C11orf24 homolog, partial [Uloborus diversus]|uniref:uncharacterized protein C11orf24 homolog n=1 Tax=Uloborus diversus TaxID=327109 RepID=UPI002409C98C
MATVQDALNEIAEFRRWRTVHTRKFTRLQNDNTELKEMVRTLTYKVLCLEHNPEAYEAPQPQPRVDPDVVNIRNRRRRARAAARRRSDEQLEQLTAATDEAQVATTEVRAATTEARQVKGELVQATTNGLATKSQMEAVSSDMRVLLERIPAPREEAAESAPFVDPTPPGVANINATRRRLEFGDPSVSGESLAPSDTDSTPKDDATKAATAPVLPSSGSLVPSDTDSTPPACSSFAVPAMTTPAAGLMLSTSGSIDPSDTDSTPAATSSFVAPMPTISALSAAAPLMTTTDTTPQSSGVSASPRRSPRLKEKAEKSPVKTPVKSPASARRKSQDFEATPRTLKSFALFCAEGALWILYSV